MVLVGVVEVGDVVPAQRKGCAYMMQNVSRPDRSYQCITLLGLLGCTTYIMQNVSRPDNVALITSRWFRRNIAVGETSFCNACCTDADHENVDG